MKINYPVISNIGHGQTAGSLFERFARVLIISAAIPITFLDQDSS